MRLATGSQAMRLREPSNMHPSDPPALSGALHPRLLRAGSLLPIGERKKELGHALRAGPRLQLLDLAHEQLKMMGRRGEHGKPDLGIAENPLAQAAARDSDEAGVAHRLAARRKGLVHDRDGLGEALAAGEDAEDHLVARHGDPLHLDPAVEHDEEDRKSVV